MNAYMEGILSLPTIEEKIEKLCCDCLQQRNDDKLYALLSGLSNQSINMETIFEQKPNKEKKIKINKKLWEIIIKTEDKIVLFAELLLIHHPENYYDIEKAVYQNQKIKTRYAMQYQSLRHVFSLEKEKKLFRNGIETRQHVPAYDEYNDLQVGDTQGSNISLTQIGDIATSYALNKNQENNNFPYGWITIHEPL